VGWETSSIQFSGDLGRSDDLLMRPPEAVEPADYVVMESTYGDRTHPAMDTLAELVGVINRTAARGGIMVIPAFAVGRAQTLLHCIQLLKQARRISGMPVYLNSPMAADATRIFRKHMDEHRLSAGQCAAMQGQTIIVNTIEESRRLNTLGFPSIIVSASGMATGGRVLHHLKAYAPELQEQDPVHRFPGCRYARGQPWWPAPTRSRSTAPTYRCAPRSQASRACLPMPTATA
jgi:metallo-beta-lactamase family protein